MQITKTEEGWRIRIPRSDGETVYHYPNGQTIQDVMKYHLPEIIQEEYAIAEATKGDRGF